MVTEYGMSDALGAISYDANNRSRFLDMPMPNERGQYSEETAENAVAELSYTDGTHKNPVFAGDTLFAESTVLEKRVFRSPSFAQPSHVQMKSRFHPEGGPGGAENRRAISSPSNTTRARPITATSATTKPKPC